MIINEKGLVRNIKYAYKREGYCIIGTREQITLFTDGWYIRADWDKFPRKALAAIAEWKDAHTMDENRLHWSHDGELVILGAIRPTASYWTRDWERTIWSAMESVDLHSRPD